jgi:putrescine transport system permease protein
MRAARTITAILVAGLLFLYLPTVVVIVTSFNESRLAGVWTGFSVRWYGELVSDQQFLGAALNSILIAAGAATLATLLGTTAGLALARRRRFRGRRLFAGLLTVPLVLPDIITGLSLLLLFVATEQAFGWPAGRGLGTVMVAHATLAMTYVAYIVQARAVDTSLQYEEAAADLGAPPLRVLTAITLPMLLPSIGAGWLLAFVLSLDDLVIASFTSGPQSTTLPMAVFSAMRLGVSPKINALATLLVVCSGACLALAAWLQVRRGGKLVKA